MGKAADPLTSPISSRTELALSLFLYGAVALLFLQLELFGARSTENAPAAGDLLAYYYPTLKYGFAELRAGRLPLWQPHQSCGTPFIAALHEGFFYPLYAPFLFLSAAVAVDVHIVLHLILASVGAFALCRHFGMGVPAALLAGLVYSYQGSMMIKVYFPDFLTSCAWIPWLLLCVDRLLEKPAARGAAALAAVLGMSFLGGHGVQFLYFTLLGAVPLLVVRSVARLRRAGLRPLAGSYAMLGIGAVLGILIGMVRLLPSAEFVGQSWRPPGSFGIEVGNKMAIAPSVFREALLTPEPSQITGTFTPRSADKLRRAYFGVVTLALALVGVALWTPRAPALAIATAGALGVLYSFGSASFVYPFLFHLPGGSWYRVVDRALILFGLAVAVLSGAGLEALLRRATSASATSRTRLAPFALVLVAMSVVLASGFFLGATRGIGRLFWYGAIATALFATLLFARASVLRLAAVAALAVLVLVDLFHAQEHLGRLPSQLEAWFSRNDDFYEAIRQRQGLDRTHIWASFRPSEPLRFHSDTAKAGLNHGIWMVTDYEPLSGARFTRFLKELGLPAMNPMGYSDLHLSATNIGLMELMGVRFYLIDDRHARRELAGYPELAARWTPILQRDGISLYEYPGAMPRAFVVERVEIEPDPERLISLMRDADLRSVAFVEEALAHRPAAAPSRPEPASAEIVEYEANRVVIQTDSPAPALLVLTDQYDEGWRATVDGSPAQVYRTDFLFRGVPIAAGRQRIEFTYRPASFVAGAFGSVAGTALTAALALAGGTAARWRSS